MDKQTLPKALLNLFDNASEGLWFMDDKNIVQFYNATFYQQYDISLEHSTLDDWLALVHPEDRVRLTDEVYTYQKGHTSSRVKTRYRVKNSSGRYLWIESTGVMVEYCDRYVMVGVNRNISEEVFYSQHLTYVANHDSETGLFNRHKFLQNAPDLNEDEWILVCCFTQLQQLQRRIGSDAMERLSSILVSTLNDVLALRYDLYRISTDVFVVTVKQPLEVDQVLILMNQIESTFNSLSQACNTTLASRLGLGALPVGDMNPDSPLEQVFSLSEYTRSVSSPVTYIGETRYEIDRYFDVQDALKTAIESHQITIVLQPIVEASTRKIISFEALARWEHPKLGSISPAEFIPMAEKLGHIHILGMEVLVQACQYLVTFDEINKARPQVNVNVSAHQLLKIDFVDDVLEVLKRFGIAPERIVLEITESYLLDDNPIIIGILNKLHVHGFKLSIDDFGAGMSAITSLFRLPLYQVKLDMALINEAMLLDACLKFITHLCEFGRMHRITLVAEGVETIAMLNKLTEIRMPYLQGYYLYRPCAPEFWLEKSAEVNRQAMQV
ncbi:EAL domain-containing protein [Pseudoalteromonas mariniglutinosa]|uniref:EAL domain-containing protein n=1 Tax=Pseudoalteromonas mariniglutinosa TaxID=206042 RepID=UPI00384BB0BC